MFSSLDVRRLAPVVCGALALGGCVASVTPVVAVPGPNRDAQAFQKDVAACRQTAEQASSNTSATSTARWNAYFTSYAQCTTAHGDLVRAAPWTAAGVGFGSGYGYGDGGYGYGYGGSYGFGYPYGYGYGYPFYPGAYGLGFGYGLYGYGGFGYGFGYGGFGHGGYGYGGFRGGYGGGYGGRGGFGGGGGHGFGFHH